MPHWTLKSDISNINIDIFQVPPLTPSTNKKVNEILKTTYATWDKDSERSAVPKDARSWTKEHVRLWLSWAMREFSFEGVNFSQFVQQFQVCIHNYNTCQAPTSRRPVSHHKPCQVFIHLQGLGSSQLADHLVNEINQGSCYVNIH